MNKRDINEYIQKLRGETVSKCWKDNQLDLEEAGISRENIASKLLEVNITDIGYCVGVLRTLDSWERFINK
jgi:hypothetical protein